jgi:hypothetical protein
MRLTKEFQRRIAAYWVEITGPSPVVSRSHLTLRNLYQDFDRALVDDAIDLLILADKEAAS